jgi:hypothetical protein
MIVRGAISGETAAAVRIHNTRGGLIVRPATELRSSTIARRTIARLGIVAYVVVAFVAFVLGAIVLQLWRANLGVPLFYANADDGLFLNAYAKVIAETGWDFRSANLGMPFGADLYEFPVPNALHFLILRLILFVVPSVGAALNLWILLQIPLAAITAYFVFLRLRLSKPSSAVVSILYALLPYRFLRYDIGHYIYSAYFLVPLAVLVAFWIAGGKHFFRAPSPIGERRPVLTARAVWAIAIAFLLACDNQYYALFALVLFLAAGLQASILKARVVAGIVPALAFCGVIVSGVGLNIIPSFVYEKQHPNTYESYVRTPSESEFYGLTLAQLVLPRPNHRIEPLASARRFYDKQFPILVNENSTVSLGLAATIGFLALVGTSLGWGSRRRPGRTAPPLATAASFNLTCVLLATVGGAGALFSYYVTDLIRAWNRIDPFIAFLALFAFGACLDWLWKRYVRTPATRPAGYVLLGIILTGMTFEQTSGADVPPYSRSAELYRTHQQFVEMIAHQLPPGSEIYELPYVHFPEGPPVLGLGQYDELFPFLHASSLRWSFGAPSSTRSGEWQVGISRVADPDLPWMLAASGFGGVLVMRDGYADSGVAIERIIGNAAGSRETVSGDGKWAFYDLTGLSRHLRARPDYANARDDLLNPVSSRFGAGCFYAESLGAAHWRWCGHDGTLVFENPGVAARRMTLHLRIVTASSTKTFVRIDGPAAHATIASSSFGSDFSTRLDVPPGRSLLRFHSDAEPLVEPDGARLRVFRIENANLTDEFLAGFSRSARTGGDGAVKII